MDRPAPAYRKREEPTLQVIPEIAARHERWIRLRRDLHAHPELAFEERRTADLVAAQLEHMGLDVDRGLAGTGVVATLECGTGPAVGLRADMDALPIEETNTFEHRSRHAGRMHACGHDGHVVMLLAAAEYLAARAADLRGTVRFIFQPAEEVAGGAKTMIDDGLFTRFPVDAVFGMHNWPGLAVGRFALRPGPMLASLDCFDIEIRGRSAHGALPHQGVDPIAAAAALVTALQTIVSRNVDPLEPAVVSVTKMQAGDAYNVIPERALLAGGIRCFEPELRAQLKRRLVEVAEGVAQALGASCDVRFGTAYPPLVNTPAAAALAADVAASIVGAQHVTVDAPRILASEDFSYMLEQKPGCYVMIGNGTGPGGCMVHNPGYDFNDAALPLGGTFWVRLAETYLRRPVS